VDSRQTLIGALEHEWSRNESDSRNVGTGSCGQTESMLVLLDSQPLSIEVPNTFQKLNFFWDSVPLFTI